MIKTSWALERIFSAGFCQIPFSSLLGVLKRNNVTYILVTVDAFLSF